MVCFPTTIKGCKERNKQISPFLSSLPTMFDVSSIPLSEPHDTMRTVADDNKLVHRNDIIGSRAVVIWFPSHHIIQQKAIYEIGLGCFPPSKHISFSTFSCEPCCYSPVVLKRSQTSSNPIDHSVSIRCDKSGVILNAELP